MNTPTRLMWSEEREGELYYVIAKPVSGSFVLAERSMWELEWCEIQPVERLIRIAETLLAAARSRDSA